MQLDVSATNLVFESQGSGRESNASTPHRSNSQPTTPKPCAFFAQGTCRNGDQCKFSHNINSMVAQAQQVLPYFVNIPPGQPVFSIDVECVATGIQHNARSIAQVALVDEWGRPIFNCYIKQSEKPVLSYINQLTGLTKEVLEEHGQPLADAMAQLRSYLTPNAILVGQSIHKDIQWLQLVEGIDYHSIIDLSGLFRVWNPSRGEYTNFSQDHCAKVWIGLPEGGVHNAVRDAVVAMSLFNAYRTVQWDINRLLHLQRMTLETPRIPGFSSLYPVVDGCCMGNRKKCSCGAPFEN